MVGDKIIFGEKYQFGVKPFNPCEIEMDCLRWILFLFSLQMASSSTVYIYAIEKQDIRIFLIEKSDRDWRGNKINDKKLKFVNLFGRKKPLL